MASNRIKGITIEIGGDTTKLQSALKGVDSSLRDTQSQLKDVNKLLKLDPSNVTLLKQKQELLGKAVDDTKKKLETEKQALEQLKASPQTQETIDQQNKLEREIIETTEALKGYEDELRKVHPQLDAFAAKSKDVAEKTKLISTAAGVFAGAMIGNAAAAGLAADDLNTLSKQTGFTTEELQKMQYASDLIDVSMDSMAGSVKKLTKQMSSESKVFDELGVSIYNQDGTMRSATDVWYDSLEALSQVENETLRDQLAMDLFGKSAADLSGIVDDGGQALRDLGTEAEELGLIMSQDTLDAANQFNDAIDRMKARTTAAVAEMGASLAGTLVPAIEKLLDWVTKIAQWFANLDGETQVLILTIAGLVAAISPLASTISQVTTIVNGLSSAFIFFTSPAGMVVAAIAAVIAIGVTLYKNWDTIKQKGHDLFASIRQTFENIKSTISTAVSTARSTVETAVAGIKNAFKFDWTLPKIKLPHFRVSGSFGWSWGGGLRMPSVSVDWYKKAYNQPVLFNSPTVIPTASGLKGFGDGAGGELVVGMNALTQALTDAVRNAGATAPTINVYGAPGQDVHELAEEIGQIIYDNAMMKGAVFG